MHLFGLQFRINYLYIFLLFTLAACQSQEPSQWQWERAEAGLPQHAIVPSVAAEADFIWAGYYGFGGLVLSRDKGQSWITTAVGAADNPVFDLLAHPPETPEEPPELSAATRDGLFHSLDGGATWQHLSEGLPAATAFILATDTFGRLYAGFDGGAIYVRDRDSQGWRVLAPLAAFGDTGENRIQEGSPFLAIISLAVSPDGQQLYVGTSGQGLFASRDGGKTWIQSYAGHYVPNIALNPDDPAVAVASLREQLVRTQDGGQSWHILPLSWAEDEVVSLLWLVDGTLGAGTGQGRLYRSQDNGNTWLEGGEGLPPTGSVLSLAASPDAPQHLWAGTWRGLYASEDSGATWKNLMPTLGTPQAQALLATENDLLLGTRSALYRWQADTETWQPLHNSPPSGANSLAIHPRNQKILYAGTSSQGVYQSEDGGESWQSLPSIKKGIPELAIAPTHPDHLYALAIWERVYESLNGGQKWAARWAGLGDVIETTSLATDPLAPFVYVGTEFGLYRSEENNPWDLVAPSLVDQSILALLAHHEGDQPLLYIGATRGIYRSLDRGETLSEGWGRGLENFSVTALLLDPQNPHSLLAGTAYGGVYQSLDGGESWQPIGPPELTHEVVEAMAWGPAGDLFIVTTGGVWQGVQVN